MRDQRVAGIGGLVRAARPDRWPEVSLGNQSPQHQTVQSLGLDQQRALMAICRQSGQGLLPRESLAQGSVRWSRW